jgi:hypothetical protein
MRLPKSYSAGWAELLWRGRLSTGAALTAPWSGAAKNLCRAADDSTDWVSWEIRPWHDLVTA